jgi:hypothetical protein
MNEALKKTWDRFQHTISEIDDKDSSDTIFQKIKKWYRENKVFLSPHLIEEYGLEDLVNINMNAYPLELSEATPKSIRHFLSIEPSSEQSMMMFLRDQLWELVVLSVDVQCHRCRKLEMSALFDIEAKQVVLECTQCGLIHTIDGYPNEFAKSNCSTQAN